MWPAWGPPSPNPASRPSSSSSQGETYVNSAPKSQIRDQAAGVSIIVLDSSEIFFKAFFGLFLRDLRVLTRELMPFLLRVGMQPLLFLFVFTFILPRMATRSEEHTSEL